MATTASKSDVTPSVVKSVRSPRNRAAAARLRVAVDKKLGLETPKWIRELATRSA